MAPWINIAIVLSVCYLAVHVECQESNAFDIDQESLHNTSNNTDEHPQLNNRVKRFGSFTSFWRHSSSRVLPNVLPGRVREIVYNNNEDEDANNDRNDSSDSSDSSGSSDSSESGESNESNRHRGRSRQYYRNKSRYSQDSGDSSSDSSDSSDSSESGEHRGRSRHHNRNDFRYIQVDPAREHGMWDSLGRDVIGGISRTVGSVGGTIGSFGFTSVSSSGLDTDKSFFDGAIDKFKEHTKLIVPGTRWCGKGHRGDNPGELGYFSKADACCRQHDLCPLHIKSNNEKYGLQNTGLFTRSHCLCEKNFYQCLRNANDPVAEQIGFTYFSVLGPQCFKVDYPIENCQSSRKGKCIKYVFNTSAPKTIQWFDSPPFEARSLSTVRVKSCCS